MTAATTEETEPGTEVEPAQGEVVDAAANAEALRVEEEIIERGKGAFIEVGVALGHIRENKLYQPEYSNFDDYVSQRWGFEKSYAHGQIAAAEVAEIAQEAGLPAPSNEGTARELVKVMNREGRLDPKTRELRAPKKALEAVKRVWEQATKDKGEFERATAKEVADIVNPPVSSSGDSPLQMLGAAADALTLCEKKLKRLDNKIKSKPSKRMMDNAKKYAIRANDIADRFADYGEGHMPEVEKKEKKTAAKKGGKKGDAKQRPPVQQRKAVQGKAKAEA
jgi:hypothetical protein